MCYFVHVIESQSFTVAAGSWQTGSKRPKSETAEKDRRYPKRGKNGAQGAVSETSVGVTERDSFIERWSAHCLLRTTSSPAFAMDGCGVFACSTQHRVVGRTVSAGNNDTVTCNIDSA